MSAPTGNRGAALLLVVMIVGLLAVLVVEFQLQARLELRAAANLRDTLQGHALARSGVAVAQVLLLQDLDDPEHAAYDGRDEDWNLAAFPIPIDSPDGGMSGSVELLEDLDGKFPLGALVDANGQPQNRYLGAYQSFLENLAIHLEEDGQVDIFQQVEIADLVEALQDWIDADSDGSFESSADYTIPNAPLTHLEDLQRIEGYQVVSEEHGRTLADALIPYLDTRATPAVNVNTAQPPVLAAMHPQIEYDDAVLLFDELGGDPATQGFQPRNYDSVAAINVTQFVLEARTESQRFRLRLTVDVRGVQHRAEAVLQRDKNPNRVTTAEWREGWMRPDWRPAFSTDDSGPTFSPGFLQ